MKAYATLCAEFYDLTKPEAPAEEVAAYKRHCAGITEPILEGMCGSGRLLIPLLRAGLQVEGVDNSAAMLERCRERCQQQGLQPVLYEQSIDQLSLPKIYAACIIPLGSFQLLYDKKVAHNALKAIYQHLKPGGFLIVDLFIPWDAIRDGVTHETAERSVEIFGSTQHITLTSQQTLHIPEQQYAAKNTYTKYDDDRIVAVEHETLTITWYYPEQITALLQEVGFGEVTFEDLTSDDTSVQLVKAYRF